MTKVAVLDTSGATLNLGDKIIVASILREVPELGLLPRIPTHWPPSRTQLKALTAADRLVFAGTNVLAPRLWRARQWPAFSLFAPAIRSKVLFLGVGWGADQPALGWLTTQLFRSAMVPRSIIGARDSLTTARAQSSGLAATNIGCPTMWSLAGKPLADVDSVREVVTTFTDYNPDPEADQELIDVLADEFRQVHFFPQGSGDRVYLQTLDVPRNMKVIPRSNAAFDEALHGRAYIGTRLHGGVRAIQLGSPALIYSVDHRAASISSDTGLPVVGRRPGRAKSLLEVLRDTRGALLRIPTAAAQAWLGELRAELR